MFIIPAFLKKLLIKLSNKFKHKTNQATFTVNHNIFCHNDYEKISAVLKYDFKNRALLARALTRKSAITEGIQQPRIGNFQSLEFLGDRILNLVASDMLFDRYPHWNEGQLDKGIKKYINNGTPLSFVARKLGLGDFLIMGTSENAWRRQDEKVLSDTVEAVLGAMWLDSGRDYKILRNFIEENWRHYEFEAHGKPASKIIFMLSTEEQTENIFCHKPTYIHA